MRMPNKYETKLIAVIQLLIGAFLGIEHILMYDGFEFELIGHETYAIILMITGTITAYFNYYRK
jgi:hypothetical protein